MKKNRPPTGSMALLVLLFMLMICAAVDGGVYWLLQIIAQQVQVLEQNHPAVAESIPLIRQVGMMEHHFWPYFIPGSVVLFGLMALLLWGLLRVTAARRSTPLVKPSAAVPAAERVEQTKADPEVQQRTYLHLIALLQRQGRLMDFFSEDLAAYSDAQIGAAVRSIHENCRKTIEKYIAPESVLEQAEGAEITVEADFDPNAMKLVGQVTGQPPFKGIVRHRGWRAGKIELPTFTGRQSPRIIAPAEIEVLQG